MAWSIEFERSAERDLARLGHEPAARVIRFLNERIKGLKDPRSLGQALKGPDLGSFWKYRVGDYRIIAHIEDDQLRVLILRIGNRREVYRR